MSLGERRLTIGRRVRVELDCEAKYINEEDPWSIGQADSDRYDLYVNSIRAQARAHGSVLDIGCGLGAMLARLRPDFERLHGIELSEIAIAKGAERYPFIDFEQGSIQALQRTRADRERFDVIVFSDALYYLDEQSKRASLRWIAEHLRLDGLAFIAAYSPGGEEYPTPSEMRTLVEREFVIEVEQLLDSDHLMLLARRRRRLAVLTLDYETWQPVPAGRRIDWEADVFAPTDALMDACEAEDACITIFAEMGEHAFLREQQPEIAARMEAQWREAIRRGHGVQMHLHPNWLPELGARLEDGSYAWNETLTRTDDHPDLIGLIGSLKRTLEEILQPVDRGYEAFAFRAGGYEAQPFRRIADALRANSMWCDSSVYHGGRQPGQYHHYSHLVDTHQPWFASHADPQLQAPPAERGIVELPVATFGRNDRWTFDAEEGVRFGERLLATIEAERTAGGSIELERVLARGRDLAADGYRMMRARGPLVNRVLPRRVAHALAASSYPEPRIVQDDFYVAVGHSKADLNITAIRSQLRVLREAGVEVVRLSEMAGLAREQLESHFASSVASDRGGAVRRARAAGTPEPALTASSGAELDEQHGSSGRADSAQARRSRARIPLDRARLLDLGCGQGAGSARIASEYPWMRVVGVDRGKGVVDAAQELYSNDRVGFAAANFDELPFPDGAFDCVYAEDSLRRVLDVDATLAEARRVLGEGGVLVAAIPPDAYSAGGVGERDTWKTSPADVRERLRHAGFVDISVEEIDTYPLGDAPRPPAQDRMLYVRAWRRAAPLAHVERVDALRRWTHKRLDPTRPADSSDPVEVLRGGYGQAVGMTLVLGEALVREGYNPRWVTTIAQGHPAGHGPRLSESHATIEITLPDRSAHVLDPMTNVRFPYALQCLIEEPTLADEVERERDARYLARSYDLYCTSFWYSRVVAVAARERPRATQHLVPARWADRATLPSYRALAFVRGRAWRAIRALGPVELPRPGGRRRRLNYGS